MLMFQVVARESEKEREAKPPFEHGAADEPLSLFEGSLPGRVEKQINTGW